MLLAGCATPDGLRDASASTRGALPPRTSRKIDGLGLAPIIPTVAILTNASRSRFGASARVVRRSSVHLPCSRSRPASACFTYDAATAYGSSSQIITAARTTRPRWTSLFQVIGPPAHHLRKALSPTARSIATAISVASRPVSGPFSGIASANQCGDQVTYKYTLA